MKSVINGEENYPCLKESRSDGVVVVLFTSHNCGTTVYSTYDKDPIGEYYDAWLEDENFTKFNGTIELSNN